MSGLFKVAFYTVFDILPLNGAPAVIQYFKEHSVSLSTQARNHPSHLLFYS